MKKFIKWIFGALLAVLVPLTLASCYDLGDYENDKDYTDSFSCCTITQSNSVESFDMTDVYCDSAMKSFTGPYDETQEFKYIAFQAEKDMIIGDVALYFYQDSGETKSLTLQLYIVDTLPTLFYDLAADIIAIKKFIEDSKEDLTAEFIPSIGNEPSDDYMAERTLTLESGVWDSTRFYDYNATPKTQLTVKEGQYILIKADNNAGYRFDRSNFKSNNAMLNYANSRGKNKVSFKFTAVLIESKTKSAAVTTED